MNILLLVIFIIGAVFLIFYNVLFFMATKEHEKEVAAFEYRRYKDKFLNLLNKYNADTQALEELQGFAHTWRKTWHSPKDSEKKAAKIKKSIDKLSSGNYNGINFLVLPGYALIDNLNIDANNKFYQKIMEIYSDLLGREHAPSNTRYLLASMGSVAIALTSIGIISGTLMVGLGNDLGVFVAIATPFFALVIAYSLLQGIEGKSKARREAIVRDFAQVATEVALLTSSGMEIFRAWDSVCQNKSKNSELYIEMRKTSKELSNGFDISVAIESFIRRCSTKETTKFGTSILQGLERGNSELSLFLSELSKETWDERKRHARSLGEKAKSKLMLPMGLIFLGILILIGVPMFLGMNDMGF